jgi:hypothetical protein
MREVKDLEKCRHNNIRQSTACFLAADIFRSCNSPFSEPRKHQNAGCYIENFYLKKSFPGVTNPKPSRQDEIPPSPTPAFGNA